MVNVYWDTHVSSKGGRRKGGREGKRTRESKLNPFWWYISSDLKNSYKALLKVLLFLNIYSICHRHTGDQVFICDHLGDAYLNHSNLFMDDHATLTSSYSTLTKIAE